MRVMNATTINQQFATLPQYTMDEVDAKIQAHNWEEATKPVAFHARGQYIGNDGKTYQMTAEYAEDSTKIFPTVQVTVTDKNGNVNSYHVDITKVDTACATEIEMFALCSHADSKRDRYKDISTDTLSSWESLLFYREMAAQKESIEQSDPITVAGAETTYNWRDMVGSVAETHMDSGTYDKYLHVNRMKDMLEYYSHFNERPAAFENPFHAIRKYENIGVLTLENLGINIEIYDNQKKIICTDLSLPYGSNVLWGGELTDEDYDKVMKIIQNLDWSNGSGTYNGSYQAFLTEYSFWNTILAGESRLEDYGTYIEELKRHYQFGSMFDNCPNLVRTAWKRAEEAADFQGLGIDKKTGEVKFISEYMRLLMEQMQKGADRNLLGTTVESAVDMAKRMIQRLEELDFNQISAEDKKLKLKERNFYYHFLENLDPTQKYDPAELLLKNHRIHI